MQCTPDPLAYTYLNAVYIAINLPIMYVSLFISLHRPSMAHFSFLRLCSSP